MSANRIDTVKFRPGSIATAASSGITIVDGTQPLIYNVREYQSGFEHRTVLQVRAFKFNIAADAALGIGQKLYTFPEGFISPKGGAIKMVSTCPTGLSATAGEIGLGSVIGTGAIATLGAGAATMEDFMEGTTISNHVAATALTSKKANKPDLSGTEATSGVRILDGTATAIALHFNICSTWDQTAAEDVTINSLEVTFDWVDYGDM